jgi:hypothetical protein
VATLLPPAAGARHRRPPRALRLIASREIVILAVTPQQAGSQFAQVDGNIT